MCGTTVYTEAKQSHDIAMRFVLQLMVEVEGTCGYVSNIKSVTNCIHRYGGALKDLHSSHLSNMFIGTPRKVITKCMHCCIVMQGCSFRL